VTDFVKKPVEATDLLEKIKALSKGTDDSAEPTAAMFRPEALQSAKEKEEMMKIEELLGWSIAPEQSFTGFPEPEKTEPVGPDKATAGPQNDEIILVEEETTESPLTKNEIREPIEEIPEPIPAASFSDPLPRVNPAQSDPPVSLKLSAPVEPVTREVVEQVAWETVPGLAESVVQKVTEELMQTVVGKVAKEIVEKVAWEVIPGMAEIVIQKEIEKLKAEE
jgi:hypothetical protein